MPLKNLSEQNISAKVIDELREAIHNGDLEPGTRLVERKLADRLGVSHIPVREALAILTEEHLVEREPRRGARVAGLSPTEVEEITSLRIVLEQFVVTRVQERWDAKAEARLRKIVDRMRAAAEKGDGDAMFKLDRQFHDTLWLLSNHELLVEITARLRGRISGFLRTTNRALKPDELAEHAEAHTEIIDALANGDPAKVRDIITDHVSTAAERIRQDVSSPEHGRDDAANAAPTR